MIKGKTLPFFLDVESERIDHYNVNAPIQKDFFEIQMSASFGSYYESYVYYQIMSYETDAGYIFEYKKNNYGIYVDPSTFKQQSKIIDNPSYESGNNLLFITLYMYTNGSQKYFRSYKKIQNVIADIGGMLSVIQTIAAIIVNVVTGNLIFTHLSKKVIEDTSYYIPCSARTINYNEVNKSMVVNKVIQVKKPVTSSFLTDSRKNNSQTNNNSKVFEESQNNINKSAFEK